MPVILGVAGTAGIVAGGVFAAELSKKLASYLADNTIDKTIKSIKTAWDSHAPTSYIRAAKPVRVEPFVMVDESVVGLPYTKDVMRAIQRIFSCNYLMAQAAQNQIGGISIAARLDRFAPDRSLSVASDYFLRDVSQESVDLLPVGIGPLAPESYAFSLPAPGLPVGKERFGDLADFIKGPLQPISLEIDETVERDLRVQALLDDVSEEADKKRWHVRRAVDGKDGKDGVDGKDGKDGRDGKDGKNLPNRDGSLDGKSYDAVIKETANLAVGQILNVKIVVEDREATMPVHVRLRPISVAQEVVAGTFSLRGNQYTMGDRLRAFRVGEIDWKDLIFQTDAVREYRKLTSKDKSGYFRKSYDRANRNFLAHLMTGKSSVGQMSSIVVTSTDTVRMFENKTGGRIKDITTRQAIMEDSLTMMIAVIDPDHEIVTIYLDSIEEGTDYLISELKKGSKNDTDDMSSLLNSLLEGRIPGRL